MCIKNRQPTETQLQVGRRQLTTDEYQRLKATDAASLTQFYTDWLDAFASTIVECACCYCIPPWLLASVLLGEVVAMSTYLGIDERTLEEWGWGASVGLGQITVTQAKKYKLTPTAIEYAGELAKQNHCHTVIEILIRAELLNPLINICASAKYLQALLQQFRRKGIIQNYVDDPEGREPWGSFDFSSVGQCDTNLGKAALHPAEDEQMRRLAKLFGAAHNDDSIEGYTKGVGMTQGENAGSVIDDLIGFGLIARYNLDRCPPHLICEDRHERAHSSGGTSSDIAPVTGETVTTPPH